MKTDEIFKPVLDLANFTTDTLEKLPTKAVGQSCDLKYEGNFCGAPYRFWLARCGVEDGEPWPNTVSVEIRTMKGDWKQILRYNGDNPTERMIL